MNSQVPAALRKRLETKLGVTRRHIYRQIASIAREKLISNRAAAFLLARDSGVSFQQYANADDRAEMRGIPISPINESTPQPIQAKTKSKLPEPRAKIRETKNNTVFVVHGRDTALNETMFALLRALGVNALEWSHAIKSAKGGNPNVGKVIDNVMRRAQAIVVMFSPDEEAKLKRRFWIDEEDKKTFPQARPNVTFEAGLALGAHPQKTLLVQVGKTRAISDIAGMHILRLSNSASSRKELAQRLRKMGLKINTDGTSWLTEGNLNR